MEKNFSKIKLRILEYAEFKGLSKRKIYLETGLSNGVLDKPNGLSEDGMEKFISTFPEIDPNWLLTGKGYMLRELTPESDDQYQKELKERIVKVADTYYVSRAQFFQEHGMAKEVFEDEATVIDNKITGQILQAHSQVDKHWLLTGKGHMETYIERENQKALEKEDREHIKDERIRSLEREVELLREMVDILKNRQPSYREMGGEDTDDGIRNVG